MSSSSRSSSGKNHPIISIFKDGSTIYWNGGVGLDKLDTYFVSVGNTVVEMFGDSSAAGTGENFLTVRCADIACMMDSEVMAGQAVSARQVVDVIAEMSWS